MGVEGSLSTTKWTCLKCCEIVDDECEVCWICGTTREGVEDPGFVTADEAGPIYDPLRDRRPDSIPAPVEELPEPPASLVVLYASRDIVTVRHIAEQLQLMGLPAITGESFHVYSGGSSVLVRETDLEVAREWLGVFLRKRRQRPEAY